MTLDLNHLPFAFYVSESETFRLGSEKITRYRGSLISGALPNESFECKCVPSGKVVYLKEETFRPTRAGMFSKWLGHAMRERALVSRG